MTTSQIFDKLVSTGVKVTNLKSASKSKLFTKEEKEFITTNFDKLVSKLKAKSTKDRELFEFNRDKVVADLLKLSVKKFRELRDKANLICECFNAGYSMGGVIKLHLRRGDNYVTIGKYDNTEEYAKTSNYRAIHGYNDICMSLKELEQMVIIGGIPTIKLSKVKISECLMLIGLKQKSNYCIEFKKGFVTGDYHGFSYQECLIWRQEMVAKKLMQRNKNINSITNLNRYVGLNHSIAVGNCIQGTKMFAQKYNLNQEFGYRLDYLMQLEPNNPYLNRLVTNL